VSDCLSVRARVGRGMCPSLQNDLNEGESLEEGQAEETSPPSPTRALPGRADCRVARP